MKSNLRKLKDEVVGLKSNLRKCQDEVEMQHAYFLLSKNVWFVFLALRVQDSIGDLVTHSLRHLLISDF